MIKLAREREREREREEGKEREAGEGGKILAVIDRSHHCRH